MRHAKPFDSRPLTREAPTVVIGGFCKPLTVSKLAVKDKWLRSATSSFWLNGVSRFQNSGHRSRAPPEILAGRALRKTLKDKNICRFLT